MSVGSERVDARGKTREFTCCGVPMQHAFRDTAMEFGLRLLEGGARRRLVAGGDRGLDFLDGGADAREAHVVDLRASHALASTLLCRLDVGHGPLTLGNALKQLKESALYSQRARPRQAPWNQRFLKRGLRFSTKAAMPSFWSSVANSEWKSRRSKRTPSASVVSKARLTASLAASTDGRDISAILVASLTASSIS